MHIEILAEDSSGEKLLNILLPRLLGPFGEPHTWRTHFYKGVGRIPLGLKPGGDPAKRILLNQLPRLLRGYGRTTGIDAVVVVVDTDDRDCRSFLEELNAMAKLCEPRPTTLFRLAIEEIEAWYLGDMAAVQRAYPHAKMHLLSEYIQDSVCGTWERLADAVHPGGALAIKKAGWPLPGQLKHEWAERIGPLMSLDANESPSFAKFRDGLRRLVAIV